MRITAIINTCNEVHHLRECVESVRQLVDEVVVCDMESTDGSAELARELGCKVITHRRMPAAEPEARVAAIEAASGEWILVFDPDMRLPAQTAVEMRRIVDEGACDILAFACESVCFGQRCTHGHSSTTKFLKKLFRRAAFAPRWDSKDSHTFFTESLSGRTRRIPSRFYVLHLAYDDVGRCVNAHVRYARNEASRLFERGVRPSTWRMFWKPIRRFGGNVVLRSAWRDGVVGLILAGIISMYVFLIEACLWALSRQDKDQQKENVCGTQDSGR